MTNESSANAIIGNTLRIIASGEYHPGAELTQKMASYIIELEQKLTDMAVQLANAESKCRALAAENAYLLPKAASELSNAWVLHKYLIGIQSAIMYLDGGNKKAAQEWLYGTISGPGFEFPDEVEVGDDIDAWATHQMRDSISYPRAVEIIKAETPATDAFLAEVRAHDLNAFIRHHSAELDAHIKNGGEQFDEKSVRIRDIIVSARLFREQIRKEAEK